MSSTIGSARDEQARAGLLRLVDAHLADMMDASPEAIISEAREDGLDMAAESRRVDEVFRRAEAAVVPSYRNDPRLSQLMDAFYAARNRHERRAALARLWRVA